MATNTEKIGSSTAAGEKPGSSSDVSTTTSPTSTTSTTSSTTMLQVQPILAKGLGVKARKKIERHTVIHRERPVLAMPGSLVASIQESANLVMRDQVTHTLSTRFLETSLKEISEKNGENERYKTMELLRSILRLDDSADHLGLHDNEELKKQRAYAEKVLADHAEDRDFSGITADKDFPIISEIIINLSLLLSAKFWSNAVPGAVDVETDDDDEYLVLCTKIVPRFNHACRPNAIYTWRRDKDDDGDVEEEFDFVQAGHNQEGDKKQENGRICIVAVRDIAEDEEICICYLTAEDCESEQKVREEWCQETLGFSCQCDVCSAAKARIVRTTTVNVPEDSGGSGGSGAGTCAVATHGFGADGSLSITSSDGTAMKAGNKDFHKAMLNGYEEFFIPHTRMLREAISSYNKMDDREIDGMLRSTKQKRKDFHKMLQSKMRMLLQAYKGYGFLLPCHLGLLGFEAYSLSIRFNLGTEEAKFWAQIRHQAAVDDKGPNHPMCKLLSLCVRQPAANVESLAKFQFVLKKCNMENR
ncbi:unnamed protein product [Amoebophrya sp. A25]|nr:unnamed protein product [Amoebophrya sp. A25]|eukprot:GSA25T00022996001.1